MHMHSFFYKIIFVFISLVIVHPVFSQDADSSKPVYHFGGGITATNNGVSLLPTFSLGKPAALFDMSVGGKKLSFDPQFRFAMEGKPWSFIFWWRYKFLDNEKFRVNVGAHPAFLFKTVPVTTNGVTNETLQAQRYVATEFSPNYFLKKNISVGFYYLYSHGFDPGAIGNTHFVTINSNFTNIKLSEQFFMKLYPQVYYLRMDHNDGFFVTATLTLAKRDFPLSLQSIVNQPIESNIPGGDKFVWNISLIYSFYKEYTKK